MDTLLRWIAVLAVGMALSGVLGFVLHLPWSGLGRALFVLYALLLALTVPLAWRASRTPK